MSENTNTAIDTREETFSTKPAPEVTNVNVTKEAANDATINTPSQDRYDELENQRNNHVVVKNSELLQAKFINSKLPTDEKEFKAAHEKFIADFELEKEDLSFEKFQSIIIDASDEKDYQAKLISKALPLAKLNQASNMKPTKADIQTMDMNKGNEYLHNDVTGEIALEQQELIPLIRDEHYGQDEPEVEEELSPEVALYLANEDKIAANEAEMDMLEATQLESESLIQQESLASNLSFEDRIDGAYKDGHEANTNAKTIIKQGNLDGVENIVTNNSEDLVDNFKSNDGSVKEADAKQAILNTPGALADNLNHGLVGNDNLGVKNAERKGAETLLATGDGADLAEATAINSMGLEDGELDVNNDRMFALQAENEALTLENETLMEESRDVARMLRERDMVELEEEEINISFDDGMSSLFDGAVIDRDYTVENDPVLMEASNLDTDIKRENIKEQNNEPSFSLA